MSRPNLANYDGCAREYGQDDPHEQFAFDGTEQIVVKERGSSCAAPNIDLSSDA